MAQQTGHEILPDEVLVGRHEARRFQRLAITIKRVGRGHSTWKQILPRVLVLRGIGLLFLPRAISDLVKRRF